MKRTNPFELLDGTQVGEWLRSLKAQSEAEKRLKAIAGQYQEILGDPRYAGIREQLNQAMGEQLQLLVNEASQCSKCCKRAERIKLLDEVVNQPVQAVWYARMQERAHQEASNGRDG